MTTGMNKSAGSHELEHSLYRIINLEHLLTMVYSNYEKLMNGYDYRGNGVVMNSNTLTTAELEETINIALLSRL